MSGFHKYLGVKIEHAVYFSDFWFLHDHLRLLLAKNDQKVNQQLNFHVFQQITNRLNLGRRISIFRIFTSSWSKGFLLLLNDPKIHIKLNFVKFQ